VYDTVTYLGKVHRVWRLEKTVLWMVIFDVVDAQKRLIHGVSALLNDVIGPDFKCQPAEADPIMDSITKL